MSRRAPLAREETRGPLSGPYPSLAANQEGGKQASTVVESPPIIARGGWRQEAGGREDLRQPGWVRVPEIFDSPFKYRLLHAYKTTVTHEATRQRATLLHSAISPLPP